MPGGVIYAAQVTIPANKPEDPPNVVDSSLLAKNDEDDGEKFMSPTDRRTALVYQQNANLNQSCQENILMICKSWRTQT